jgi:hypothetical protein
MIKLIAVTVLLAAAGSSISEFSLSPGESFTLHCEYDYVFTLSQCGTTCVSLEISQMIEGIPQWTGHLFDLKEQQKYPVEWEFDDVVFDSVYVVRTGDMTTLRVSYREPVQVLSQERVVKVNTEQQKAGKTSMFIIFELGAVIFLIFLVVHRVLYSGNSDKERPVMDGSLPSPVVGFHDWQGYNQIGSQNIGREMGREIGMRREAGIPRQEEDEDLELLQRIRELEKLKKMEMKHRIRRIEQEEDSLGLDWV